MGKTNRVVVCGLKRVGKTSIIEQSIYGNLKKGTEIFPTIEDIYVANVETDRGSREKFNFYDTAGFDLNTLQSVNSDCSAYASFIRQYAPQADCFIFVYDTSSQSSLDCVCALKQELDKVKDKKEIVMIVFAHNMTEQYTSLSDAIKSNAIQWCTREKIRHFDVDAFNRKSLHEPFIYLASKLSPVPNRSSFPQLSMVRKTVRNEFN
ncbi:NF-kappa-B inhibitor-interacting Ras-like protein [Diaphorina citri]|uniref:NF-kappa-B inhibitor-interacting Ras-like protein n=1 Tax=Diaphorina citri TaxID=121845 RepID=A0A1S3D464_DIACI|nr:NF-kappa-B inhibitor-interacting Ras-like protein [Diaphorina citri]